MTNVIPIADHAVRAISRLTQQFRDKENIAKLIQVFMDELNEVESVLFDLLLMRSLTTAVGAQLDIIGEHVGSLRAGQNDTEYKIAIGKQIAINISNATEPNIHDIVFNLTNATTVQVTDTGTAEVTITTDGSATDPAIPGVIESMIGAGIGFGGLEVIFDPEVSFAFRTTDEDPNPPAVGEGFSSTDAGFETAGGEFISVQV
jgi:hypothetical protein